MATVTETGMIIDEKFKSTDLNIGVMENIGKKVYEMVAGGDYEYKRKLLG